MKLGVAIPQTDIGSDPLIMREFAQTAEAIGFQHLAVYDHVLGANIAHRPDWSGTYTSEHSFHDPFVLFGYLAGQTESIELTTQVLILPQRQTALVAKQAASVDVLSGGRLRLGIGLGWNSVEYVGLNQNFKNRGRRSEEQVTVMKQLWTQPHVIFKGNWHEIPDAGINPLPIQRPIPVWFGGQGEPVLKRIAKLGDGWITLYHQPNEQAQSDFRALLKYARDAGRAEGEVGIDVWVSMGGGQPNDWREEIKAWKKLGVTHITLNTAFDVRHHQRIAGTSLQDHIIAMRLFFEAVIDLM
jgi:probable F420-dependent oxidoreductase